MDSYYCDNDKNFFFFFFQVTACYSNRSPTLLKNIRSLGHQSNKEVVYITNLYTATAFDHIFKFVDTLIEQNGESSKNNLKKNQNPLINTKFSNKKKSVLERDFKVAMYRKY